MDVSTRALVLAVLFLTGCGGDDEETGANPSENRSAANQAPTISGSPPPQALQDQSYIFSPTAADANNDTLTFSISGLPSWASFNTSTGKLSGIPTAGNVGVYPNIQISVSDGHATISLARFTITVVSTAAGSATLSWGAPTQNTDGSALTDLAGYRIYWGTTQGDYPNSRTLNGVSVQTYVVEPLTPGTWHFVVTALNSSGAESIFSNAASKTVP